MPVFFIERDAIRDGTVSIAGPLARHLKGSLRVRPGETVWLGESGGPRYQVRITAASRDRLTGDILSESAPPVRPGPRLTRSEERRVGKAWSYPVTAPHSRTPGRRHV